MRTVADLKDDLRRIDRIEEFLRERFGYDANANPPFTARMEQLCDLIHATASGGRIIVPKVMNDFRVQFGDLSDAQFNRAVEEGKSRA